MKKILLGLLIVLSYTRCSDILDIENLSTYNPDVVWGSEASANAYVANLYPLFGNWSVWADKGSDQTAGIDWYEDRITLSNTQYRNWNYSRIRSINQVIADVDDSPLDQDAKNFIKGQALTMRAWVYFSMVKYHGGVPYIMEPQDRYEDDLYVSRNTTAECFDYIVQDLEDAIGLLPQQIRASSEDYGKIDGNFASAIKGKVLLYKASPQFNPDNPWGNSYWNDAYTYNKSVYESLTGQEYALIEDYSRIALTERNSEVIFSVINSEPDKTANWDFGARPGSVSRNPAHVVPSWEFVKRYPMKDGKLYTDPTSAYHKTDDEFLQSFWENRDPRFEKSILWNGKLFPVAGRKEGYRQYTSVGIADEKDDFGINPNAGASSTNLDRFTGFYILKNCNLALEQVDVMNYDIDYVVMRLAEVILNYAEAANEAGHMTEAVDMVKLLRVRAGIDAGTDGKYGINDASKETMREVIIGERDVELGFEGHRFWDLRRLRMLDRLNGSTVHGVEAIAVNDDGSEMTMSEAREKALNNELTEVDFKYSVLQMPRNGVKENVLPYTYYFFPLLQSSIDANENLKQNVDWGGTFDPTL